MRRFLAIIISGAITCGSVLIYCEHPFGVSGGPLMLLASVAFLVYGVAVMFPFIRSGANKSREESKAEER